MSPAPDYLPGCHLLLDLHGAAHLSDAGRLEAAMRRAAAEAGAEVLEASFRTFAGGGVTGVLLLAESHITIHTWPELSFAAVDVFMCGRADPDAACATLIADLEPASHRVTRVERGGQRNQ